jgi:hypothetical protein
MNRTSKRATESVATSPEKLTVERTAEVLGLSRRAVIQLLGDGTLTWTMAADRQTVLVEMPSDRDTFLREIGASGTPAGISAAPTISSHTPASTAQTLPRRRERPSLADVDAWSQPK